MGRADGTDKTRREIGGGLGIGNGRMREYLEWMAQCDLGLGELIGTEVQQCIAGVVSIGLLHHSP